MTLWEWELTSGSALHSLELSDLRGITSTFWSAVFSLATWVGANQIHIHRKRTSDRMLGERGGKDKQGSILQQVVNSSQSHSTHIYWELFPRAKGSKVLSSLKNCSLIYLVAMSTCTLYFVIICVLEVPVPVFRLELVLVQKLWGWAPGTVKAAGLPLRVLSTGGLPVLQGCCRHCQWQSVLSCYYSCSWRPRGA